MLGFVTDTRPTREIVELYKELMPDVPWLQQSHGPSKDLYGVPFGYHAYVWRGYFATDPSTEPSLGWKQEAMNLFFPRARMDPFPMTTHRHMAEICAAGKVRGFGRIGGDFWPVLKTKRSDRAARISEGRYPRGSWRALNIVSAYLAPGPDGPVSTARFEMLREGLQECEARIFLEGILIDDARRAKLGEALETRVRGVIAEHTVAMLQGMSSFRLGDHFTSNCNNRHIWWESMPDLGSGWFICTQWRKRTERLFTIAAETAIMPGYP